jgi:SulP family sulfate permease
MRTFFAERFPLLSLLRHEFAGYNGQSFRKDLLAGITVGAVGLPLALAFGVASGADAAAGLVTAILSGIIIGGLGGSSFQISGPTGAMSAVLIVLAQRYGLSGVWVACLLAGIVLLLLGLFRLGRYIAFIPSPVITGFTSGIALIIAIGQLDNVLGIVSPASEGALDKIWHYLTNPPLPNWQTALVAGIVMLTMIGLPYVTRSVPGSLVGIILASLLVAVTGWDVPQIGNIPQTILLEQRLTFATIPWSDLPDLIAPAISVAALGAIESLLCGSVGATMTGKPFDSNQELIGQGIGNLIIPFFGGVPATAAIARTSVAIKSGAVTRLTSMIHALVLLLSVFVLAPLISRVPLAALGGALLVTAWRMNEWETIRFFTRARLGHALSGMLITMVATVALDLTQAILIGFALSAILYIRESVGSAEVVSAPVSLDRLRGVELPVTSPCPNIHVYYLTGPIFFGSVHSVLEAFKSARDYQTLIISMRGVPLVDVMGAQALNELIEEHHARGGDVYITGLQPAVRQMLIRTHVMTHLGDNHIFWSADQAILAAHHAHQAQNCPTCSATSNPLLTPNNELLER